MYAHILIPLENTAADEAILAHIQPLARLCRSRLTLVHVADGFAARNQEALNLDESEEMKQDRAYLERRRAELTSAGFSVRAVLECGDPTQQIVAVAQREGCDLIAMSTHGHGLLQDVIRGSVASGVRHQTLVPVLMVRSQAVA